LCSGYNVNVTLSVSAGALAVLREMADGFIIRGDRTGSGPFCIVPTEPLRVVSGTVSRDLPRADFCIELVNAGLCEPLQVSERVNPKRCCYRISRLGYDVLAKAQGELE
jgi:hypothetical protein